MKFIHRASELEMSIVPLKLKNGGYVASDIYYSQEIDIYGVKHGYIPYIRVYVQIPHSKEIQDLYLTKKYKTKSLTNKTVKRRSKKQLEELSNGIELKHILKIAEIEVDELEEKAI